MRHYTPREDHYVQYGAILIIGIDKAGRIFSRIEKNGATIATDIFVRLPSEATLIAQGWTRDG